MKYHYQERVIIPFAKSHKRLVTAMVAVIFAFMWTVGLLGSVRAASDYFNGFEVDTTGWNDYLGGVVTRVGTGSNGITSSDGSYHAEITGPVFTRWGGYESAFPVGGYDTEVDVYLDMDINDTVGTDMRFDFSSAINKPDGDHRRDFVLSVGTDPGATGQFLASASNNAPGWPGNPGRSPATIDQSGWYTIRHEFRDVGGVLEVTVSLINDADSVVGSWILSDPSDLIGVTVGGSRYGWFTSQRFDFAMLAIDNAAKIGPDTTPPEVPASQWRVAADDGEIFDCGDVTTRQILYPTWEDNAEAADDFAYYEYNSFNNGAPGLVERVMPTNQFVHSWTPPADGTFEFQVRSVDVNGNASEWTEKCAITYDSVAPSVELTNPSNGDILSGTIELTGVIEDDNNDAYRFLVRDWEEAGRPTVYNSGWMTDYSDVVAAMHELDTTQFGNGEYRIVLVARDQANNRARDRVNVYFGNSEACKKDGWRDGFMEQEFRNQGDCVSHFSSDTQAEFNPDGAPERNASSRRNR